MMKKRLKKILTILLVITLSFSSFHTFSSYYVSAEDKKTKVDIEGTTEVNEKELKKIYGEETAEEETTKKKKNVQQTTKKQENETDKKAESATEQKSSEETKVTETTQEAEETSAYEGNIQEAYAVLDTASSIPDNAADLAASGKDTFVVTTYEDVLAIQSLSRTTSLEGYKFRFSKLNNSEAVWNLKDLSGFTGFGCDEFPFKGTIEEAFVDSVTFETGANPLFQCLGSGAEIINFEIKANSSAAGMAQKLLITDDKPVTFTHVKLTGTVANNSGNAGALYSIVESTLGDTYNLNIDGNGLDVKNITVSGKIAGGYIGEVTGNINVLVSDGENVAKSVTAVRDGAAGGIIGKLSGSSLEVVSEITIGNTINCTTTQDSSICGGIVAVCENGSVTSQNKVTKNTEMYSGKIAGGFIGQAVNSNIIISDFIVTGNVRARLSTGSYAGGVIGHYINNGTDSGNVSMSISHVGVSGCKIATGYGTSNIYIEHGAGGIAGFIQGDNVIISNMKPDADDGYAFTPNMSYQADSITSTNASGRRGGIIGIAEGKNITVSDVTVSFTSAQPINGHVLGGIIGTVNEASKIKLENVKAAGNYIGNTTKPQYDGGLIGYVNKGCIIALSGTVDLSGINYKNDRNGGLFAEKRGYVAAYQDESLIYLEDGGNIIHNAEVEDKDNSVWTADYYNYNTDFLLDDIGAYAGTYGNVFKNVPDKDGNLVIQYGNAYGQEVTGTVSYADGFYQLTEDADSLRLAIALNTFDASGAGHPLRFAAGCFNQGETADTLLGASYKIMGDLDFERTGIYSLCRNDNNTDYVFTGNIEGEGSPSIRLHMVSKQQYGGLFTKIKGNTFKNFNLEGDIYYVKNSGGIAPFAEGSITLDGISTNINIRTSSNSNTISTSGTLYYYGGVIANYNLQSDNFISKNCVIAPVIDNIRIQQMAGGMIGWLRTTDKEVSSYNIQISNTTVKSRIKASVNFNYNVGGYTINQVRAAGMISQISYDVRPYLHDWSALGGNYKDVTCAKMILDGVTVDGADIDMSSVNSNKANVRVTGGFLGYDWNNVEVVAENDINVTGESSIKSIGHVGGLITTITGKLDFNGNINLMSMDMSDKSPSAQTFSGLLIGDGRNAVITITESKYSIDTAGVTVHGYSNFDEIVGVNNELSSNYVNNNSQSLPGDYKNGGILNIIKPEFGNMALDGYGSYSNRIVTSPNKYTRYYYNLFGSEYENNKVLVSGGTNIVDTQEKLMLWHLYQYSNTYIKRFLKPYFVDGSGNAASVTGSLKLSGELDMRGYSFYPSRVSNLNCNAEGAVLILYAEDIERQESSHGEDVNKKTPSAGTKQHYMMHAGLFCCTQGTVNVSGLTIKGTAANLGKNSGALLTAGIWGGTASLSNITCDGLRLADYAGTEYAGLLVGTVSNSATLKMDGITTASYDGMADGEFAAAALIGTVGSTTATDTHVSFKNMKVEDEKEKVFRYASFIYSYDYVDNSNTNKSSGIYIFTKDDFDTGNVTFGSELKYGVDYYDADRDSALQEIIDKADTVYNPYVYRVKKILVNPRNGDLTEGCGTYEDPYIISTKRQFLTLYCYLTGKNTLSNGKYTYQGPYVDILNGSSWKVNPIGGGSDDGRCNLDAVNTAHTPAEFDASGNNTDFPTIDQMRKAYYLITADLDMSVYSDLNEYTMEMDFSGLGTTENPFAGVLVGRKSEGTVVTAPTITLPKKNAAKDVYWASYGLVQYMQGAVVKNLNIKTPDTDADYKDNKVQISSGGSAGAVAAVVLGGDNIIDSVSVNMQFKLSGSNTNTIKTGGYVGYIKKGSVIVRSLQKTDVENYAAYLSNGTVIDGTNHNNYPRNSRVIGWVEDGNVIYEGTLSDDKKSKKVLEQEDFGFAGDTIPLSFSFPMVNGVYLEEKCNDTAGKINVADDGAGGYTVTINNDAQLMIAEMAFNSDAFSIYDSGAVDTAHKNGYDHTAVCRKADYDNLGGSVTSADCMLAIENDDNKGYYPYFYWKYMDFNAVAGGYEGTQAVSGTKRLSKLNWSDGNATYYGSVSIGNVTTTYTLIAGNTYDLWDYGRSFRGFGALYNRDYSLFKANFNGNGAFVKVNMCRDWDTSVNTTGFFNNLTTYREEGFSISGIHFLNSRFDSRNAVGTTVNDSPTGSVAGNVKGVWDFSNIIFEKTGNEDDEGIITGSSYVGGMVGRINYYSASANDSGKQKINFTNCVVQGTQSGRCILTGGNTSGGMVGYIQGENNTTYFGSVAFNDCAFRHGEISLLSGKSGNLGGFIGRAGYSQNNNFVSNNGHSVGNVTIGQTNKDMTTVEDAKIYSGSSTASSVGGLIGVYCSFNNADKDSAALKISGVRMDGMSIESSTPYLKRYGVGGLVGGLWSHYVSIKDAQVKDSVIGTGHSGDLTDKHRLSTGGLIGSAYTNYAYISDSAVEGCDIRTYGNTVNTNYAFAGGFIGDSQVATELIIFSESSGNTVKNTSVKSYNWAAGGIIGSNSTDTAPLWDISGVTVDNSKIYSHTAEKDGDVTLSAGDNYAAGGILGRNIQQITNMKLKDINVVNGTEIAANYAGGMAGWIITNTNNISLTGNIHIGGENGGSVVVYGCRRAGGLYGYNQTRGTEYSSADVKICNAKVGAYSDNNSYYATAGGIAGGRDLYNKCQYDGMEIKNSVIAGNHSNESNVMIEAGGIFGYINQSGSVYIYNPKFMDNSIGYLDNLTSINSLKNAANTSNTVKLLGGTADSSAIHRFDIAGGITEQNVGTYSIRIGNYIGVRDNGNAYILRPELNYSAGFTGSRPAIDVGNKNTGTTNYEVEYGYGYPYEWRQYCHIVYYEPDASADANNIISADLIQNGENEYLFDSADDIINGYNSGISGDDFLNAYNLNVKMHDSVEGDKYKFTDYYDKFLKDRKLNNIKVVYADGGTPQSVMDSVAGILTNAGGIDKNHAGTKNYLSVTIKKAKITSAGKIESMAGGTNSMAVDGNNNFSYTKNYDEILPDGSYTISLVAFRYGWTGVDGQGKYETIYVPVFVVERIDFYNDIHIMEGEQYSMADAHDSTMSYSGSVTVAHDSTFTLFAELAYGKGRKKASYENFVMNKALKFSRADNVPDNAVIPEGVKLTLVDVQTQVPYYYTVPEGGTSSIDFTLFKDMSGNQYVNRTISNVTNTASSIDFDGTSYSDDFGLEQFYIYVDASDAELDPKVYMVSIDTDATDSTALNFFNRTESPGIKITSEPGLSILFHDKGSAQQSGSTNISGEISKTGKIKIDASIKIEAGYGDIYWAEKRDKNIHFIDSQNNNKYLDVAIYLIDNQTGEYVTLPANTNIIVNGQTVASVGQSVMYSYKDWNSSFKLDNVTRDIVGYNLIMQDDGSEVSNECHIELDFSVADIDDYISNTGKDYSVKLELRRTSNPDYPLGGDMLDEYSAIVLGKGSKEMAVALNVDDTMDLGINTYKEASSSYQIPFTSRLDFSGMISVGNDGTPKQSDIDLCAARKYLITYRLMKKVEQPDGSYQYVSVGTDAPPSDMEPGDELKLTFDDGTDWELKKYNGETVYQAVKVFDKDEIINGTDGVKYVADWTGMLNVDTSDISTYDYSNYKVEITVLPFDSAGDDIPENDNDAVLKDYIIYTIGKLKTDI